MAEETYSIVYLTDVTGALPGIDKMKVGVLELHVLTEASIGEVAKLGITATKAAKGFEALAVALDALKGKGSVLSTLASELGELHFGAKGSAAEFSKLATSIESLIPGSATLHYMGSEVYRVGAGSQMAATNLAAVGLRMDELGAHQVGLMGARSGVQGIQRAAFGLSKNLEDAGGQMSLLKARGAGLGPIASDLRGVGVSARSTGGSLSEAAGHGQRFMSSLGTAGMAARIVLFQGLKSAIEDAGKALSSARDAASEGGDANLSLRDKYRELANLQGKAEPDNEVLGGALRFRLATGATDEDANKALRRFEGGLPTARAAGNITGTSTSGVAGDFFRESVQIGTRVNVSGETSGLLASKIAQSRKIATAEDGVKEFATIVDTMNRATGDLTPLISSLVKTSGGLVNAKGGVFKSLPELAAAIEVTSLSATPTVAGTRVRQAATALGRFGEESGGKGHVHMKDSHPDEWARKTPMQQGAYNARFDAAPADPTETKVGAGDTLKKLGIQPGMDFVEKIERLAPLVEGAKDADVALAEGGFKNQAERRALVQLVRNRKLLRTETETARKGVDMKGVRAKNALFFKGGDAQNRIAKAQIDAEKFAQFNRDEPLQIARKSAEARLRKKLEIDTASSNYDEYIGDMLVTRTLNAAANRAVGNETKADLLPVSMGGKSTRQLKIDKEAYENLEKEAEHLGFDPRQKFAALNVPGHEAPFEERFAALSKEVEHRGGKPYGDTGQTDAHLRELIFEVRRGNDEAAKRAQQAPFVPRPQPRGGH